MLVDSFKFAFKYAFKHAGWPMLFACVSAVACSKTPAPVTAFISADLEGSGALCPQSGSTVLLVGDMTAGNLPSTWTDGQSGVSLSCRVSPSGDGFDLQMDAKQPGNGQLTISGHVTTADNGGKVTAQFAGGGATYISTDCAVTYVYLGSAIAQNQRAVAGSFFGHISCPDAMNAQSSIAGQQVLGPDGGVTNAICDGEADVLFQNCDQ